MALIDKASLLMVPSVYEDGTLYNVLPSGNKAPDETGNHNGYDQTRADFTFSRGSNLAATRVNASGLIEKGRENLLLQSNSFDVSANWINNSSTESSGFEGYDGTSNAWKLTATATSGAFIRQIISFSNLKTFSVYAKVGTSSHLLMLTEGGGNTWFDLVNGIIETDAAVLSNIESIGNDWYRCSVTWNSSITGVRLYVCDADGTSSVANGGFIYLQNAQLENGLVATDYIETGSVSGTAGVLENTPRIDYSSGAGALLLEPQRTNLLAQSEYYNTYYTRDGVSVSDNALTSPEGLQNASKLVEDSANSKHRIGKATFPSGTQRTLSVFAKAGERNYISLFENNAVGNDVKGAIFNLSNGTLSINNSPSYYSNPTIEPIGSNGWYRCSVTWTPTSLSVPSFGVSADGLENTYQGDGTSGIYIWGGMLEEASHVSSYVPTYGSAATRGADSCSVTGVSDVIGQTEGTLYAEVDWNVKPESGSPVVGIVTLNNGANNLQNSILLGVERQGGGTNRVYCFVINSNVTQAEIFGSAITDGIYKIAFAYKANDFALYVNGSQIGTDTSGSVPALNEVFLGKRFGTDTYIQADGTKQAVLFDTRLTNSELATLTTL